MNDFTASNGFQIVDRPGGFHIIDDEGEDSLRDYSHLSDADMDALREFFRTEDDARLGRWRSTQYDYFVVYPDAIERDLCIVVNESGGKSHILTRDGRLVGSDHAGGLFFDVAAEYFDAHPEPKPWRDAEPGEGWLLTIDGHECAAVTLPDPNGVFCGVKFETAEHGLFGRHAAAITAGRRFWPEASA